MARRHALPEIPVAPHPGWHTYSDGSYYDGITTFGLLVIRDDVVIKEWSTPIPISHEGTGSNQIVGELFGAMAAAQWMDQKGVEKFELHFDYTGVKFWATEIWPARQWWAKQYVDFMATIKARIVWNKIDKFNENSHSARVHELANNARHVILA